MKICKRCRGKIKNASSRHQIFCSDCHNNAKKEGHKEKMSDVQDKYNKETKTKVEKGDALKAKAKDTLANECIEFLKTKDVESENFSKVFSRAYGICRKQFNKK